MFKLILSLILVFVEIDTAKILGYFPTPSISHQVVFRPVMLELARRGHEVTVITTDPAYPKDQAPPNLTEIDVRDISYQYGNEFKSGKRNDINDLVMFEIICDFLSGLVEKQLKSAVIQNFLHEKQNFDLIFVESYIRPALLISHVYDAPVIEFSSVCGIFSAFNFIGAATHPIIYPDVMHKRIYNLTSWEKIRELYIHYGSEHIFTQHEHEENEMLKTIFGPNIPSLSDLKKNVHMLFLNVHPVWDFNRPVPPNVVYLGGLHQKPQQDLPKDLKSYLDSSTNGVIYISFGTNVNPSMLPLDKIKIFTDVFSQLSYNVLWKWDDDELPVQSKNIRFSKWLPQSNLLRHPNIRLFITQGGLQSTDEAITAGVPLVGVPMHGDQWFNTEQYVKFNIGKRLLIETLTEEQLLDAITTVIDDKSYRRNIVKLRDIMTDQAQSPLERAVWWTEHVLRHGGGAHLRAPAAHMHWTDYYELELVLILLSGFVAFAAAVILAMFFIVSKVRFYMTGKSKAD